MSRRIIHVDMDEFFAAVEKLDNPSLRGKPILVGGDPRKRGVVSTASYEARPYGCHSAMPMSTALRLCPSALVLPVRGRRYQEVSRQVFEILERFTPLIEPLSIDEAFLDVTGSQRLHGPAEGIAEKIRQTIRSELGLTASAGVAPNKFLAKLASDLDKPDGLTVITESNIHDVLDDLDIRKLWGVGPAMAKSLGRVNIQTIGQLRRADSAALAQLTGKAGDQLQRLARGEDDREVTPDSRAKSIGQEETFAEDIDSLEALAGVLLGQVEQVGRRLRRHGLLARTVTLKLRYGDFTTITRSSSLPHGVQSTDELWRPARALFDKWARASARALRLLGFTASSLTGKAGAQLALFGRDEERRRRRLDEATDRIQDRFGRSALRRGSSMRPDNS